MAVSMSIKTVIKFVPLVLIAVILAGCGSRTNLQAVKSDQPLANTQLLTDIPIPNNASMDNERSLVLADRDHWVGRVVMRFWQNTGELTAFYQAQMPGFGWEPVMSVTSATSILTYTHGDHAATVQIEDSTLGLKTQVSITVAPRQALNGGANGSYGGGGNSYGTTGSSSDYNRPGTIRSEPLPPR
jgi:hypothetical protein